MDNSDKDISLSVLLFTLGIFGATYDDYPYLKAYAKRLKVILNIMSIC